jgi:amidohydrolase
MIENGILEGLEAAYAIHVDPTLPSGTFGVIKGATTAAAIRFNVTVSSSSTGHSARPHEAIDTVWVATQIANQLYQLSGRLTDPRDATILTICRFQGGEALNVIPARVEFGGTLRCTSLDTRRKMQDLLVAAAHLQGQLVGATVDVKFDEGIPPVMNDGRLVDLVTQTITSLYGPDAVHQIPRPSMGAEDFANYQQHVPGVLLRVGTSCNERTSFPLHDAHFDIDEAAMEPTARLMAQALIDHLNRRPLSPEAA